MACSPKACSEEIGPKTLFLFPPFLRLLLAKSYRYCIGSDRPADVGGGDNLVQGSRGGEVGGGREDRPLAGDSRARRGRRKVSLFSKNERGRGCGVRVHVTRLGLLKTCRVS